MENSIATAEDFQRAQQGALASKAERVVLPKLGRAVLLRRPTPMWFLFHGQLPTSLAARAQNGGPGASSAFVQTAEDLRALADWMAPLLQEVFVEPRLSLNPGPGEISPDLLDMEDANFVVRWAVGEIGDQGSRAGDRGEEGAGRYMATSLRFVAEHPDQLLLLGQVAETWHCRPSELLGVRDSGVGVRDLTMVFQIDTAAAVALWRWRERLAAEAASQ